MEKVNNIRFVFSDYQWNQCLLFKPVMLCLNLDLRPILRKLNMRVLFPEKEYIFVRMIHLCKFMHQIHGIPSEPGMLQSIKSCINEYFHKCNCHCEYFKCYVG